MPSNVEVTISQKVIFNYNFCKFELHSGSMHPKSRWRVVLFKNAIVHFNLSLSHMTLKLRTSLAFTLTSAFLAACGGGGDSAPAGVTTFPLDAAYTKALTSGVTLNGTAVDGADTYTMALTITPAADEVFEGVTRKKAIQSLTMKKNGAVLQATNIQVYFSVSPFVSRGARYSDGTYGILTSNTGSFSSAAKVGDGGPLGILTIYTSSSKTSVHMTSETTWSLEADTASTAYACVNGVDKSAAGAVTDTFSGCYKIDASGNYLGLRYTLSVPGKTLVFK